MRTQNVMLALHPPASAGLFDRLAREPGPRIIHPGAAAQRRANRSGRFDQAGGSTAGGKIAVLPVRGFIDQHPGWMADTALDDFGEAFDRAVASPEVSGIVLDIESPGGSVYGVAEMSDKIFAARGSKPIVAVANATAFSAAYWLFTAAGTRYVTPSGEVGSVGVWVAHIDVSRALDDMGWRITLVHAGKYKVEGNQFEPLADEARQEFQRHVDRYYDMFVGAVARNVGKPTAIVKRDFGQGRLMGAKQAVAAGMADKVGTLETAIADLAARAAAIAERRRAIRIRELELALP